MGKYSPGIHPFRMTTWVASLLEIYQYIDFTLYMHYFISRIKKYVHKNVRNKIYKKY